METLGHDFSRKEMARIMQRALSVCTTYPFLVRIGTLSAALTLLVSMVLVPMRLYTLFPDRFSYFSFLSLDAIRGYFDFEFWWAFGGVGAFALLFGIRTFYALWSDASIITAVHYLSSDSDLKLGFWRSLWIGLKRVFVMFEYESVTLVFDLSKLWMVFYYLAAFFGIGMIAPYWWLFLIAICFQLFFSVLLVYGKYNAIIENGQIFASMKKSMTLVAFYLSETFLLLAIVALFVVFAGLFTLLYFAIPALSIVIIQFLVQRFSLNIALYIGGLVALFLFYVFSRLIGYAQVYLTILWTLVFKELNERKEHTLVD